jgi:hypothetical protein
MVIVDENAWEGFLAAAGAYGFTPRRNDALAFAKRLRIVPVI